MLAVEPERLRHAQARRVQQLEQRPVAERDGRPRPVGPAAPSHGGRAAGRLEQALDLLDRQRLGQQPRLARQVQVRGDVHVDQAVAVREAVEAADRGRAPAQARGREARVVGPAAPGPRREVPLGDLRARSPSRAAAPRLIAKSRGRAR